jgi:hypothetical protein
MELVLSGKIAPTSKTQYQKMRNMCGPSFVISVELRLNAVKRSHLVPRATPSTDRFLSVLAHLVWQALMVQCAREQPAHRKKEHEKVHAC